jgi:hypothetical protein
LERIHYLLVAGFNVFGNLSHQLHTRLYMDFLRMEGEDLFLSFLPTSHRKTIRDSWYQGMREDREDDIGDIETWLSKDVVTGCRTNDPQRELYKHLSKRLAKVLRNGAANRCQGKNCVKLGADADKRRIDKAMQRIAAIRGKVVVALPDVIFVRVRRGKDSDDDLAYTVIRDKAYKNVTSILDDEEDTKYRDFSNDALTVVDWLEGSYPNFFASVGIEDIDRFLEQYAALQDRDDFEKLISMYGIRRTNSGFWDTADWFQDQYLREKPVQAGLLDLNRYFSWRR